MAARIAFIGLGNMGAPMAANLIEAGYPLTVFDLVEQAMADAVALGAERADSAAAAARGAEIVISMLPAGTHVAELYQGEAGLLDAVAEGTLLVDCSTIDAETARQVAAAASERGLPMLDAPVSGGVNGAKAGGLTFMVGGEAPAVEQASPLFDVMGKTYFHAGPAGAGQVAKMCNNMLLGILMTGTSEAINLAVANGLDPSVVSDIMKNASGGNWALNVYNPWPGVMEAAPASNDYQGGFLVDLMTKDLGLAWEMALGSKSAVPMGSQARNLFVQHAAQGAGRLDFSSIQRFYRCGEADA